jgi:hypothetical protein
MIPSPVRAYDSRLGDGPLAVGQARAFNLVPFGIPNPVEAVLINLTVVNTSGRGYLAVAPGLPLVYTPGSYSNINWSGPGLVLANNATSTVGSIDPEAMEIVVYCEGAGSTDFIIDLQGYYV